MVSAPEQLGTSHKASALHNLFFAIMVPETDSPEFAACFQGFQKTYPFRSKPIGADRLHLSVYAVWRGNTLPHDIVQMAIRTGDTVRFTPFSVTFTEAMTYRIRRAPMPLVLTAQESAEAVNGLRFQIGSAYLRVRGHGRYQHKSISPHVTLAWDSVIVAKQPIKPLSILAREFALVHSHVGESRYTIVKRWPLVRF